MTCFWELSLARVACILNHFVRFGVLCCISFLILIVILIVTCSDNHYLPMSLFVYFLLINVNYCILLCAMLLCLYLMLQSVPNKIPFENKKKKILCSWQGPGRSPRGKGRKFILCNNSQDKLHVHCTCRYLWNLAPKYHN